MRHVTDDERRARLGIRHGLAASARLPSVPEVVAAMTTLHATEPASVHLSCWARMPSVSVAVVDAELYTSRSVVKQSAMRQTLWVVPRDVLPAVLGSSSARLARSFGRTVAKDAERAGLGPGDGGPEHPWVDRAGDAVLAALADDMPRSVRDLRRDVPELEGFYEQGQGTKWASKVQLAPRLLTLLNYRGLIARGPNDGPWYASRPTWTRMSSWLGEDVQPVLDRVGYREVVDRWLWTFGPGTVEDIAWWLGDTKSAVRTALADLGAVAVSLDGGGTGWVRADDQEPPGIPDRWVSLLPLLDPTVMGWRGRAFYLGPHAPQLFDSVGNAGTTVWVDGRVVGAWVQDHTGRVQIRMLESVDGWASAALAAEAERLTGWLGGQRVFTVYPSRAMQSPAQPS